jgi:hypothetical protein
MTDSSIHAAGIVRQDEQTETDFSRREGGESVLIYQNKIFLRFGATW